MRTLAKALCLSTLLAAGCGWRSDGLERLEELYPTPVAPDAGSSMVDIGEPRCRGLSGTWAVRLVQPNTISPLGEVWTLTVTDLFLGQIDAAASSVELTYCDSQSVITTPGGKTDLGRSQVPVALQEALAAEPVTIRLPGDGTFSSSEQVWLWGLKDLADPLHDPLPSVESYATDARVFDQDSDTQPGVTLHILSPAGDRYLVRRVVWSFGQGKLTLDNAWITGALDAVIEEVGLGATNAMLLTPAPMTPKAQGTGYQLRCVGESYRCSDLAKDHVELFKRAPK